MTCWGLIRKSTDYVDGCLRGNELARVKAHLRDCDRCDDKIKDFKTVRSSLRELPKTKSPRSLRTKLRVLASQERRLVLEADGSRLLLLWNEWKVRFQDLMRPFTIPATGGLCSSMVLFGALAFTIGTTTRGVAYDVPVIYSNFIDANLVPMELRSSIVLTFSLDNNGHITDYTFRDNLKSVVGNPATLQQHNIDMPEIPNVMAIAQPMSSAIRISVTPVIFRR